MKKSKIAALLMFATGSTVIVNSYAYEPERALVNFSHELAECAAYFLLYSLAPGLDEDTSKELYYRYELSTQAALATSNEDVTKARIELATKTMQRDMKGSWSNMSIINNKYGYTCIDLLEDPEARMNYWYEKED